MNTQMNMVMKNEPVGMMDPEKRGDRKKDLFFRISSITKIFSDGLEWLLSVSGGNGDIE